MIKKTSYLLVACLLSVFSCGLGWAAEPYQATWKSLKKHSSPEWFRDAKFGIYTHWGPVTVPAEDGPAGVQWYGRNMYAKKSPTFQYHREKYGDQKSFGYCDVIPLFKASKFDARAWADLFSRSGAKFAGPVVIHHDNYAMWDSALTRWDCVDQSPQRDFTAELEQAIRAKGMKFIATFHHAFAWEYFEPSYQFDAADGKHADLYCQPHQPGTPPSTDYLDRWLGMVNEVVGKYRPDLIWFDFGLGKLIPPDYQQRMFADYYNWAAKQERQVGVAHKHWDLHEHTGIIDFERGRLDHLPDFPWLTDTSVGPWFHQKSSSFKTVDQLVDVLVDIVSKNGCMLLNVGPTAEGEIPPQAEQLLTGIGKWLDVNGEALFATRPWEVYGEGPTRMAKSGGFSERKGVEYTNRDVRYTQSKDGETLYAIVLGWPKSEVTLRSLGVSKTADNARVKLLGYDGDVEYSVNPQRQLKVAMPELGPTARPCGHAFALKMTGFSFKLHPDARFNLPGSVTVPPEKVTLQGSRVRLQDAGGRPNIGAWDDPGESCHWLVPVSRAGTYVMRGEFSSAYDVGCLKVSFLGRTSEVDVPKTEGWYKTAFVRLGIYTFDKPGVHHLTLAPADPKAWKAVNVWNLQLAPITK